MRVNHRRAFVILCLGLLAVPWVSRCRAESLSGTVVSPGGKPVAGALVEAVDLNRPWAGLWPSAASDKTGHFRIAGLRPGPQTVMARKPGEFYPPQIGNFYDARPLLVQLAAGQNLSGLVVRLSKPGARLIGNVVNQETGQEIRAEIHLSRPDIKDSNYTSDRFDVLVPAAAIKVQVTSPGFEACSPAPFALSPRTTNLVLVRLRPAHRGPPSASSEPCWFPAVLKSGQP